MAAPTVSWVTDLVGHARRRSVNLALAFSTRAGAGAGGGLLFLWHVSQSSASIAVSSWRIS
uniref:Uncharacterized protein n=1 Tax=Anopheles albimanus TaxID=7167 RepID=A0A182F1K2_ANOAL